MDLVIKLNKKFLRLKIFAVHNVNSKSLYSHFIQILFRSPCKELKKKRKLNDEKSAQQCKIEKKRDN